MTLFSDWLIRPRFDISPGREHPTGGGGFNVPLNFAVSLFFFSKYCKSIHLLIRKGNKPLHLLTNGKSLQRPRSSCNVIKREQLKTQCRNCMWPQNAHVGEKLLRTDIWAQPAKRLVEGMKNRHPRHAAVRGRLFIVLLQQGSPLFTRVWDQLFTQWKEEEEDGDSLLTQH